MSKREQIIVMGVVLALLYLTAAISFYASSVEAHEPYEPACTEIHKQDHSPRTCDE